MKWINVNDDLPVVVENAENVEEDMVLAFRTKDTGFYYRTTIKHIEHFLKTYKGTYSHWMKLPHFPKEAE